MPELVHREYLVANASAEPRVPKGGVTIGRHLSPRTAQIICAGIVVAAVAFAAWVIVEAPGGYPAGWVALGVGLTCVLLCMLALDNAYRCTRIEGSAIVIRSFSKRVSVEADTIGSFETRTFEHSGPNHSHGYRSYAHIVQKDGTRVPLGLTSQSARTDLDADEETDELLRLIAAYLGLQFEHVRRKAPDA